MGACLCKTDESTLTTPIGSCSLKHCGCWGKKDDEDESLKAINDAIRAELVAVEFAMRQHMLAGLRTFGDVIPVQVLADGMKSPVSGPRALTVRIKTTESRLIS